MNKIEQALVELEDACSAIQALRDAVTGCCFGTTRIDPYHQSAHDSIHRARKLLESANRDSKVVSDLTSWMED